MIGHWYVTFEHIVAAIYMQWLKQCSINWLLSHRCFIQDPVWQCSSAMMFTIPTVMNLVTVAILVEHLLPVLLRMPSVASFSVTPVPFRGRSTLV